MAMFEDCTLLRVWQGLTGLDRIVVVWGARQQT
jgi:hypothetical protein